MAGEDPKRPRSTPIGGMPRIERETTPGRSQPVHRDYSRPQTQQRAAVAAPDFIDEENSQAYEVEQRKRLRSARPTGMRLERLEDKHDVLAEKVNKLDATVGKLDEKTDQNTIMITEIRGDQKTQNKALENIEKHLSEDKHRERLHVEADIDINKAKKIQLIKTVGAWREWVTKILAIVSTLAAIVLALIQAGKC